MNKEQFLVKAIPGLDAMIPARQKQTGTISGHQLARALLVCVKKGRNMDKVPAQEVLLAGAACAAMGLLPGDTGQAHIWAVRNRGGGFSTVVTPGYKGLLIIFRRLGWAIRGACVFGKEEFQVSLGTVGEKVIHVPLTGVEKSLKNLVAAWVSAHNIKTGEVIIPRPVSKEEIEQRVAAAAGDSPWKKPQHLEAMAMKTAIRKLTQLIPMDTSEAAIASRLNEEETEIRRVDIPVPKEIEETVEAEEPELAEELEVEVAKLEPEEGSDDEKEAEPEEVAERPKLQPAPEEAPAVPENGASEEQLKDIRAKFKEYDTSWHYVCAAMNLPLDTRMELIDSETAKKVMTVLAAIGRRRKQQAMKFEKEEKRWKK